MGNCFCFYIGRGCGPLEGGVGRVGGEVVFLVVGWGGVVVNSDLLWETNLADGVLPLGATLTLKLKTSFFVVLYAFCFR